MTRLDPRLRAALLALALTALAVAVDARLFLREAGAVVPPIEALGLGLAAIAAVALTRRAARPALLATPIVGFLVFRLSLGTLIGAPDDAVIRDAQAGFSVLVVVGAQLAIVALGVALARGG